MLGKKLSKIGHKPLERELKTKRMKYLKYSQTSKRPKNSDEG